MAVKTKPSSGSISKINFGKKKNSKQKKSINKHQSKVKKYRGQGR